MGDGLNEKDITLAWLRTAFSRCLENHIESLKSDAFNVSRYIYFDFESETSFVVRLEIRHQTVG